MNKIIKDLFTQRDNETFDIIRLCFFISFISLIAINFYNIYQKNTINIIDVSNSFSLLLASASASIGVRSKLEDEKNKENKE